jgi:hypothetical protein
MKKTLVVILCSMVFVVSLFLVSCQKKEEAPTETGGYGEKAEEAAGYGEKAEETGEKETGGY